MNAANTAVGGRRSIRDIDLRGKRAVMRADLNAPIGDDGHVADDTRLRAVLPTLNLIRENGGSAVLLSHLGRPSAPEPKFSLAPVASKLSELLGAPVHFCPEQTVTGEQASRMASELKAGEFLLLENLRFNPGEKSNDPSFASQLASLGDIYVNDAFGTSHRSHASVVGIAERLPAVSGLLLDRELEALGGLLKDPERPFASVLGGSKVSDKLDVITRLLDLCDKILIGGAMCFTFFKARGYEVGDSLLEEDQLDNARRLEESARAKGVELILPTDVVIAQTISDDAETRVVPANAVPKGWKGLDIGPDSAKAYAEALSGCKTIFWNGPMGVFELDKFAEGTRVVADAVAVSQGKTIVGGGDTDAAVHKYGIEEHITHISTGGGASMQVLEGKQLPGVEALGGLG